MCSASGSTHTVSGKLYRKVKHRASPKVSSRQRPKRALTKRRSPRRLRHRAPHTGHGLGVLSRQLAKWFLTSLYIYETCYERGRGTAISSFVYSSRAIFGGRRKPSKWETIIEVGDKFTLFVLFVSRWRRARLHMYCVMFLLLPIIN